MSILCDKEIISLCEGPNPMISPFKSHQVRYRTSNDPSRNRERIVDGVTVCDEKIVSYGTSSFGYDVRCGNKFKIFTNINSTIVDPKNFDEKSFVEYEGDCCIIPPNSFALANTVEYFRIPRDILTICVGKSTYARCFTGDTKVALVDGTSASFEDLVERAKTGERFWGYSVDDDANIVVAELTQPRKIGHERIIEVELDNGEVIKCTPDHKFILLDGSYVEAQHLQINQSLMPLYRVETRGYEAVVQPTTFSFISTHHLSDAWNLKNNVYEAGENEHRHHANHNRRDNRPTNIVRKNASEHLREHNAERMNDADYRSRLSELRKEAFRKHDQDPSWHQGFVQRCKAAADAFWNSDEHSETRQKVLFGRKNYGANMSAEERQKRSEIMRVLMMDVVRRKESAERFNALWEDPEFRANKVNQARSLNLRTEITECEVRDALEKAGTLRGAARLLDCDRTVFRRFRDLVLEFKDKIQAARLSTDDVLDALRKTGSVRKAAKYLDIGRSKLLSYKEAVSAYYGKPVAENHKVAAIREVSGTHDVYCLSVPEHGNFALEAGVFVKNCGIIVNVTPFEPEWEGFVTLEFSNTTPLPAKIYANEGCAQVLFFRGDVPCEVSYRDRAGKYMNQVASPVIPRV